MILETSDLSLTDTPFVASVENLLFVERIEKALRQLSTNLEETLEVFDILNGYVLDRM